MKVEFFEIDGLEYLIRYPEGFCTSERYPAVMYLHGAGNRGSKIESLAQDLFFLEFEKHDLPMLVVAPVCSENTWFDMWERLEKLTEHISALDFVDSDRLYLIGVSMGGYATWQLSMSLPQLFAAAVPICGGGMYWNAERLKNVPVWAFHGGLDIYVFPEESRKMVDAVNAYGGEAKLTVYPDNGHDAWTDTFRNRQVFEWLLSQRREQVRDVVTSGFDNAEIFG